MLRQFRSPLALVDKCTRCKGPVSEAMLFCPWCATKRTVYKGPTRHSERCPRCKRGIKLDWKYCPWCYGRGFKTVSTKAYQDAEYSARCANPACKRKLLMRFMRTTPLRRWPGTRGSEWWCSDSGL